MKLSVKLTMAAAIGLALTYGAGSAMAQRAVGIDVYSGDGAVTWSTVHNNGYSFGWAKATEGNYYRDANFTGNMTSGKAAGVYMGAYHFSRPDLNSPATEASYFWSFAGGYITADGKSLSPALDLETFNGYVGEGSYSAWVNAWCADVVNSAASANRTVKPTLYVSACNAGYLNTSVAQWIPWISDYNGESCQSGTPWSTCSGDDVWGAGVWDLWQYADTSAVPGVPGNQYGYCDQDVFNGALSTMTAMMVVTTQTLQNRVAVTPTADGNGYWIGASDGGVFAFGDAGFDGSMGGGGMSAPAVCLEARPQGDGYWLVGSDGSVYSFGNAGYHGGMNGTKLNAPIVGICSTASGAGYWEVGSDGGIYAFGDAPFNGSMGGQKLNAPIVGMARTSSNGYWLVGSDGGIYSFSANFYGSMGGTKLSKPVVGIAARPQSDGYWLTGSDGAIYAFGNAGYDGGMNGYTLSAPIVGIAATPSGGGYWLVGKDGAIYSFGNAPFEGGANFP